MRGMSFRDDREAAHHRADALEQELKKAQEEVARLRAPKPRSGRSIPMMIAVVLGVTVAAGAGAVLLLVSRGGEQREAYATYQLREAEQRARAEAERAAAQAQLAAEAEAEASRARAAATEAAAAQLGPAARIVWQGSVDRAEGLDLAAGTPCTFEGSFASTGRDVAPRGLTISCAGQVIHRAGEEMAGAEVSLREGPVFGGAAHEYMLRYHDERPGRPTKITMSTLGHTAVVWREGDDAMRVTMFVRDVSEPREGAALVRRPHPRAPSFAGALERAARVTAVSGRPSVAVGERCVVTARPVWEFPENCRMAVRCGTTWLYGAREAGYLTCELEGGRPVAALDENTSDHGGDPRVTWRGRRVTVSDFTEAGAWSVDIALGGAAR
jgi:hypothetical protein